MKYILLFSLLFTYGCTLLSAENQGATVSVTAANKEITTGEPEANLLMAALYNNFAGVIEALEQGAHPLALMRFYQAEEQDGKKVTTYKNKRALEVTQDPAIKLLLRGAEAVIKGEKERGARK